MKIKTKELFLPGFEFTGERPSHHDEKFQRYLKSISRHQERLVSMEMAAGESLEHMLKRWRKLDAEKIDKKVECMG